MLVSSLVCHVARNLHASRLEEVDTFALKFNARKNMDNLRALCALVRDLDKQEIVADLLLQQGGETLRRFYVGIRDNVYMNEADALADLYPGEHNPSTYSMTKARLRDALVNMWYVLQPVQSKNEHEQVEKALLHCEKSIGALRAMVRSGKGLYAEKSLRRVLSLSEKYEFTQILAEAHQLMASIATLNGDSNAVEKHQHRSLEMYQLNTLEIESDALLRQLYSGSFRSAKDVLPEDRLMSIDKRLGEMLSEHQSSFKLKRNVFRGRNYIAQYHHNYALSAHLCEEMEHFYEENSHLLSPARLAETCIHRSCAHFHLGEYETGAQFATTAIENRPEASNNWLIAKNFQLLNTLHLGNVREARDIINSVLNSPNFSNRTLPMQEKWRLYDSLVSFVESTHSKRSYRASVDDLQHIPKDYKGYNIIHVTISLLDMLANDEFDVLVDRVDSLRKYIARHVKSSDPRSHAFLKSMEIMIRQNFNVKKTEALASKHILKLKEEFTQRSEHIEIVPYEMLWKRLQQISDMRKIVEPSS